jgi:DNA-binding response OmpR family regulator
VSSTQLDHLGECREKRLMGPARRAILWVEDRPSRDAIAAAFSDYEVVFVTNAFEALRATSSRAFYAHIIDRWLRDWDGMALCRQIRQDDPHAVIFLCSNKERPGERVSAIRAGALAYVTRPLDLKRLHRQLRAHMDQCDLEALRAKAALDRAVQEELDRRLKSVSGPDTDVISIERTARPRAYKAFVHARGTRAYFESWWPFVFGSAYAARAVETNESAIQRTK